MEQRDVIIIGAGPSGLFCALHLPQHLNILILEKTQKAAQKLLLSAKGRGNLTNTMINPRTDYVTSDSLFVEQIFQQYSTKDFLNFLTENEIPYTQEETGRILLSSGKVSQFHDFLLQKLATRGITIRYGQDIESLFQDSDSYSIQTTSETYRAQKVILATGTKSIPHLGSSDFALQIAKELDLQYSDFYPALVGFETEKDLSSLSGSSLIGKGELYFNGKLLYEQT